LKPHFNNFKCDPIGISIFRPCTLPKYKKVY